MTVEQAYAEGFCKAAEAAGVDPQTIIKIAQKPRNMHGVPMHPYGIPNKLDSILFNTSKAGTGSGK